MAAKAYLNRSLDNLEMLVADYRDYAYALHTHPTYVFGVVTAGVERFRVGRSDHLAGGGTIIAVNPEEPHDGEKGCELGWSYRTCYPSVELIGEIAGELGMTDLPLFPAPVLEAPDLAQEFVAAHRSAAANEPVESEALMLLVLGRVARRFGHLRARPAAAAGSHGRLRIYDEVIEATLESPLSLALLAEAAGVTRFQVVRDFGRAVRMTPGQYIRDRRVRRASALIRTGSPLAEIALAAGFADQSHFTRVFKSVRGLTPAAYRAAVLG